MVKKNGKMVKSKARKRNTQRVVRLPNHYPRAIGDEAIIPFHATDLIIIPGSTGGSTNTVAELLVLGKGTSTTGYTFLNSVSSVFSANAVCYSRWMVTNLKVVVRATGVGGTANTFVAASYIPSNSTVENPPVSLAELSQSNHYAESSLGTVGSFVVNPADYFNDWRQITDTDDSDAQAGVIQLYGSGVGGTGAQTAGVVSISGNLHFCGLRV